MIVNRDRTNLSETQTILTIPLNVRKSYWTITEKKYLKILEETEGGRFDVSTGVNWSHVTRM